MKLSKEELSQKIGQMLFLGFDGTHLDPETTVDKHIYSDVVNHHIGGVILFDYDCKTKKFDKNIQSPEQLKALCQQLKNLNDEHCSHPLYIGIDYEGGLVNRLKTEYGFPETMPAAQLGTLPLEEMMTHTLKMATVLKEMGINLDFAPDVDVNRNPKNPIIGEKERSFGCDYESVIKYANVFLNVFAKNKIQTCLKHFPGHGSSDRDTHEGFVDITETWDHVELKPFELMKCDMIMIGHLINKKLDESGLPATLSHQMITGLLRNSMGYEGIIIADDLQMQAITDHYNLRESIKLAINAGNDILLFGNQLGDSVSAEELTAIIFELLEAGEISEDRIVDAYERIVRVKNKTLI